MTFNLLDDGFEHVIDLRVVATEQTGEFGKVSSDGKVMKNTSPLSSSIEGFTVIV